VVHENWEALLKKSPVRNGDWLTPYHLGVIAFERGDREAARDWWKRSLEAEENPWAYRNLGIVADPEKALAYYKKAFELSDECSEDYICCLLEARGEEAAAEALNAYMKRQGKTVAELSEALREIAARIALSHEDDQTLDLIFSIEPAHIREGNTALIELWLDREAIRLVKSGTCAGTAEAREQVRGLLADGKLKAPGNIDFRMY
jgi:tetratricopeptide (TPR) repeat protein